MKSRKTLIIAAFLKTATFDLFHSDACDMALRR